MDSVFVDIRSADLVARLSGLGPRLRANLLRVINRLSLDVQRTVKEQKLTGQVLHVRTGTLRRSINRTVTEDASGIVALVGTNVWYGRVHEYGFSGQVNVREHVRRLPHVAAQRYRKKGTQLSLFREERGTQVSTTVRAHVRNVVMPERSFLRSTLKEMSDRIREQINQAVLAAFKA